MAKKKKAASPAASSRKKSRPAPRTSIDPALLDAAVERIRATRLGLEPDDRRSLGRDLGRRYLLELGEGYQLKNLLEADDAGKLAGRLDDVDRAVDPLGVAKFGLGAWIRTLLPETIDPLDEPFAEGLIEGLRDTAETLAERLKFPPAAIAPAEEIAAETSDASEPPDTASETAGAGEGTSDAAPEPTLESHEPPAESAEHEPSGAEDDLLASETTSPKTDDADG